MPWNVFRPRAKSRAPKAPRDLLPLDLTNASIGISEREIKTEDDDVVHKEITHRMTSDDPSVTASLDMAKNVEKSRKTWELAHECFRASVYHQTTKTWFSSHFWVSISSSF